MSLNSCPKVHFFQDIFPIPQITNSLVFLSSSDKHKKSVNEGMFNIGVNGMNVVTN